MTDYRYALRIDFIDTKQFVAIPPFETPLLMDSPFEDAKPLAYGIVEGLLALEEDNGSLRVIVEVKTRKYDDQPYARLHFSYRGAYLMQWDPADLCGEKTHEDVEF